MTKLLQEEVVNRLTQQFNNFNCYSSTPAHRQLHLKQFRPNNSLVRQLPLSRSPPRLEFLSSFRNNLLPSQHQARPSNSLQLNNSLAHANLINNSFQASTSLSQPRFNNSNSLGPNSLKSMEP